jgi:DNA-binding CsgD family transcriptional regulator
MVAECEQIAAGLDDDLLNARIKEVKGHATLYQGDLPTAMALLEEAGDDFRAIGNALGEFDTLVLLTAGALFLQDPRVDEFGQRSLDLAESYGALSSKGYAQWCVGVARWRAGDPGEATRALRECLRLFLPMHDLTGISFGVQALAWVATLAAPDERAARLLGASQAAWRTSGAKIDETNSYSVYDQAAEEAVRAEIGDEAFEEAFAEGAAYSFDQVVTLALGQDADVELQDSSGGSRKVAPAPGGLTRREREVALLLAEGLTNREIANRLVISQRTAETHVDHILGKLGLTSRVRVASWVAEHLSR